MYLANRLSSRKTYLKYQTTVMGPINDRGVEQGSISSSKLFQLTTDNELQTLNASGVGVPIGSNILTALGQADDEVLLATNSWESQTLINLAVYLSTQMNCKNVPTKTTISQTKCLLPGSTPSGLQLPGTLYLSLCIFSWCLHTRTPTKGWSMLSSPPTGLTS